MAFVAVSIIMPVYNSKNRVRFAIESVLSQDFDSFELILVDDGSTDSSGIICDEYAKEDSRIHVIHQENAGTSAARNAGLKIAKGKYITFCDHDDEYLPHLLRDNYELIEKEKADVLQFSINRIYTESNNLVVEQRLKNGSVLAEDLPYKYLDVRLNENFIDVWNHFYKRDIVSDLTFDSIFNHGMEDICFNLALMSRVKQKYVFNSGVYYNHYLYSNSSGSVSKLKASSNVVEQLQILFDLEYDCLKNFFAPQNGSERRCVKILKKSFCFLVNRVNLASKKDFDKFRKMNLFCNYPFKLSKLDNLFLWSFNNNYWLFRFLLKLGFGDVENGYEQSWLYVFFYNLYRSKRGRWLFDLCDVCVKVLTLPFRLVK
ncbi:glycosyltransferase [Fibrobacter sp. UWB10]|uniref:glycosyltransferase n=1 Tax=Fibrobacter sp. UWB10 TaxID=1896201 RepID=UPI00240379A5|nr:glycosyltransferase [Fibrobacter sp. UWB10]SMP40118.1 Glycosyltransferase involved in cell wall bisynthesis [Fibrobacter sp. UWB10]